MMLIFIGNISSRPRIEHDNADKNDDNDDKEDRKYGVDDFPSPHYCIETRQNTLS
jgi:hypothetical protein